MSEKIVITSGKGGVGKTTVAVMLARQLSLMKKKVCIIDLDFTLNNLDVVCGVEEKAGYDIEDVVSGRCRVKQALINVAKNLYIIPSHHAYGGEISGQNIKLLVDGLEQSFDYIFLDCPAGVDAGFHRAVCSSKRAFVIVNNYPASLRDADKVINLLSGYELDGIYCIVNRLRTDLVKKGKVMSADECGELLKTELLGVIPEDDEVLLNDGVSIRGGCSSVKAMNKLAKNVIKVLR